VDESVAQAANNALVEAEEDGYSGELLDSFRSANEQQAQIDAGRPAADVGSSGHEAGTAMDMAWRWRPQKEQLVLQLAMNRWGFAQTYSNRAHFEHRRTRGQPARRREMIERARRIAPTTESQQDLPACNVNTGTTT
jgi:hypothetical protein